MGLLSVAAGLDDLTVGGGVGLLSAAAGPDDLTVAGVGSLRSTPGDATAGFGAGVAGCLRSPTGGAVTGFAGALREGAEKAGDWGRAGAALAGCSGRAAGCSGAPGRSSAGTFIVTFMRARCCSSSAFAWSAASWACCACDAAALLLGCVADADAAFLAVSVACCARAVRYSR